MADLAEITAGMTAEQLQNWMQWEIEERRRKRSETMELINELAKLLLQGRA